TRTRCGKAPRGAVGYPAPRGALPQRAGHLHVRPHAMQLQLQRSTFRLVALAIGAAAIAGTFLGQSFFPVAVGAGVLFGVVGHLTDHLTGGKLAGGQLSSWALAAGGAVVAVYWSRVFVVEGRALFSIWWPIGQYIGTVLFCWGTLML